MGVWTYLLIMVLLILVVLVIFVVASTITVQVHLILRSKEYRMFVTIRMLYGLINKRYEVPFQFNDKDGESASSGGDDENNQGKVKVIHLRGAGTYRKLIRATDGFKEWVLKSMQHVSLSDICWSSAIALDNAAETAVAAGTVWGIKHTILGWLSYHLKMISAPKLNVLPEFNGPPQLSTDFNCVASISCGKAIVCGLLLFLRVLKVKGGIKVWQNTLFKA
ncbi:DUF2953 domain-containing protein [Paenibacillus faecalis]|uniref:DUF2953 domain-containing protein n=1 Tax=Paenibacillus faecalis TaxID=2079532 RepID=UPI000D0EF732|nr:DUF2953 domain-containing protein [Paenibacillus faecalis]